jgi:hypothetical protein
MGPWWPHLYDKDDKKENLEPCLRFDLEHLASHQDDQKLVCWARFHDIMHFD